MKKILRLVYPFFIYTVLGSVLINGAFYVCQMIAAGMRLPDPVSAAADRVNGQVVYWTALSAVIASVILYHFYKKDCVMRGRNTQESGPGLGGLFQLVLLGMAACLFGNHLVTMLALSGMSSGYEEVTDTLYSIPFLSQILCLGICIPVGEEFVFRILGFRRLRDYMGFAPAAFISAVLFGLYHGNIVQAFYAAVLGFIMALAYEYQDRFIVPIVIHASANILTVILTALPEGAWGLSPAIMLAETAAAFVVIVAVLRWMRCARA